MTKEIHRMTQGPQRQRRPQGQHSLPRGEEPSWLAAGHAPREAWGRRDVLKLGATAGGLVAAGAVLPAPGWAASPRPAPRPGGAWAGRDPARVVIDGTDVRALAMRALDAAKAAGADYADVRLTRQLSQSVSGLDVPFGVDEQFGVGVRVRVQGAWGFAGSPYWTPEEVVALAQNAVIQAKANARVALVTPAWVPIPVASGHWTTPIKIDPFTVPVEEKIDLQRSWETLAARYRWCVGSSSQMGFLREERAVATSEGAYFTQTRYRASSGFQLDRRAVSKGTARERGIATARGLNAAAAGYELLAEADLPGQLPRLYEEADPRIPAPPVKPGDVGRYDVVFDATAMGMLLENTLGVAAQVDRALGYEANAGGTSYLGPDPLALLGSYQAASPLVTVTANRSMRRGVGTVKWDDEGVEPEDFTLVKDGLLVDYQTTRELAGWLAPWYEKQGQPVRSHGCAWSQDGSCIPLQHTPNLVLEPGQGDVSFEALVADTKKGLALLGNQVVTDFQQRTGVARGEVREIVNGKLGAVVTGLECLFTSTALWKNVVALGGAASAFQYASGNNKGQPTQGASYSVRAVPAKVKDVDFIDPKRKA